MSFDSFSEFLHMGGHGPFVWSAYAITLVVLGSNVVQAWRLKRNVILNEKRVIERENARNAGTAEHAESAE